ncbi:MAG: arsenite methyltransferase [bacterium]
MKDEEIRKAVREGYGRIAVQKNSCCGPASACGSGSLQESVSNAIGYTDEQLRAIPDGASLGLGCGNPTALASLKEGEVVLDLGSGAGIDCFLAANAVGESGRVIGVDMTAEMLERARENARKGDYQNVEFRLGEIENLPVADNSVDVVISNCVINLSPDKGRVFKEAYRALKPGGRIMISDIVLLKELPDAIKSSIEAYVGCVAGATTKQGYLATVEAAGFQEVEVVDEVSTKGIYDGATVRAIAENLGISPAITEEAADSIVSIRVRAVKPN